MRYVLKLSAFRSLFGVLLRPIAALVSLPEYRMYQMVADLEGIPEFASRHGLRG